MPSPDNRATVVRWMATTTWYAGVNALEVALSGTLSERVRVVVDETVATDREGRALLDRLGALVRDAGGRSTEWRHRAGETTVDRVDEAAAAWSMDPVDVCVLVGGGSTIDFGLLALLPAEQRAALRARGRTGFVLLPDVSRNGPPTTVVVPTTLGTGAEMSQVACVEHDGKRLVLGGGLRADIAVCDPAATRGLPPRLVREAIVEVAARLVVPFAAPRQEDVHALAHALGDDVLLADLAALLRVADRLGEPAAADGVDDDTRLALAAISAHSHGGWAHVGRGSFSSPLWFVATELSRELDISKSQATAVLLPAWAVAVSNGRTCWGDADRLRSLEARVEVLVGQGSREHVGMVARVCALVPRPAGLPNSETAWERVVDDVTERSIRRWGAGLPMLAGVTSTDVRALLNDGLHSATRPREIPCST